MRAGLFAALLFTALAGLACLQQSKPPPTKDIVSAIPWHDQEQAQYVILDRKTKKEFGRDTLSITRQAGQFALRSASTNANGTDASTITVDATTLKPISLDRKLNAPKQSEELKAVYDASAGIVNITEIKSGNERPVPMRLGNNYYDNDSSLFVWRTITFQEGYEVAYRTVVTGSASQFIVELTVARKERVTVPAGTFDTWRVEVRSGGVEQIAWYADTAERPLVQYDNSIQLFQLTALQ